MQPNRDLIRRNKERVEHDTFDRLKAEPARAFAAPDRAYQPLDADTVIRRGQQCSGMSQFRVQDNAARRLDEFTATPAQR